MHYFDKIVLKLVQQPAITSYLISSPQPSKSIMRIAHFNIAGFVCGDMGITSRDFITDVGAISY